MKFYLRGFCFLVFVVCSLTGTAQTMTRSESLFGGFERVDSNTNWPETLELPSAWRDGFREMVKKQKETNREQAACLIVTTNAQGGLDATSALAAFQALLAKQKSMSQEVFTIESARLRKIIEGGKDDSNATTRQLIWKIGQIQGGNVSSVNVKHGLPVCDSTSIGQVHTHPQSFGIGMLSDTDLAIALKYKIREFAVDLAGDTCVLIPRDPTKNQSKMSDFDLLNAFDTITFSKSLDSEDGHFERTAEKMIRYGANLGAAYASKYDGKLYCGNIDNQLKLITPLKTPSKSSGDQGIILAAKAATIMQKKLNKPDWPEINFPFTPVLDEKFIQYLKMTLAQGGYSAEAINSFMTNNDTLTQRLIEISFNRLRFVNPAFEIAVQAPGFNYPDFRVEKAKKLTNINLLYGVQSINERFSASLTEAKNIAEKNEMHKMQETYPIAVWYKNNDYMIVNTEKNEMINDSNGIIYTGGAKYDSIKKYWIREGDGVEETATTKTVAKFKDGKMFGDVRILDKTTNTWSNWKTTK